MKHKSKFSISELYSTKSFCDESTTGTKKNIQHVKALSIYELTTTTQIKFNWKVIIKLEKK
uniref:CSON007001 protein n=1 Tax=Culicoides sonorensis TaxID=179676 RepID=A0A336MTR8_CULSO